VFRKFPATCLGKNKGFRKLPATCLGKNKGFRKLPALWLKTIRVLESFLQRGGRK